MFTLIPTDKEFFDLLDQVTAVLVRSAEAFHNITKDYASRQKYIDQTRQCEHDGDELVHRAFNKLDTSFLTPLDREDIHLLFNQLDNVIDDIDAVAKRFTQYKIEKPTPWIIMQADVMAAQARELAQAVSKLRNLKKPNGLADRLVEIHRLENVGDDNNHAAIEELFTTEQDPMYVMKWKEIYERTERAIDACEDVSNTIERIVLKNS